MPSSSAGGAQRRFRGLLLFTILIAWGVRLHRLAARPLWVDEAFSLWMARPPVPHLIARTIQIDQHPPLYYLLLKGWTHLLGEKEWALRSLSVFWGVLTIPLAFLLARRLLRSRGAALVVATIVALSPFHVRYAQEARMYTLLAFWGLLTLWLFTVHNERRHLSVLLGASMALTALSHNTGLLVSLVISTLFVLKRASRKQTVLVWGMFAVIWLPWLPAFVHQAQGVMRRFWVPWPTARDIFHTLHMFHAAYIPGGSFSRWGTDGTFLALAGLGMWQMAGKPPGKQDKGRGVPLEGILPAIAFLLPLAAELVVSPVRPILQARTLIWTTFPYYMLIVAGMWRGTRRRRSRLAIVLLTIAIVAVQVAGVRGWWRTPPAEAWDQVALYVAEGAKPDDLILFNAAWTQIPFDYYAERLGLRLEEHGLPEDISSARELEPLMTEEAIPRLEGFISAHPRTWLIYSHEWYTDPDELALAVLSRRLSLQGTREFSGIRVFLFTRTAENAQQ